MKHIRLSVIFMKIAIIDIGSNSVRLALTAGGKTLYKRVETARLSEGLGISGKLTETAIIRTAKAVDGFKKQALRDGAEKVYVFATEAVRSASNGAEFVKHTKERYGIDVDVISGETEADIGLLGALGSDDGGIIDLGGASCEVTVRSGGSVIYCKSVGIGAVRILENCNRDRLKIENYISEKLPLYGDFNASSYDMYGISGTAITLSAVKNKLEVYDPKITHGTVLTTGEIGELADRFLSLSVEEIKKIAGMVVWRADIIGGATLFLYRLLQKLHISEITVSENDNLEGYLIYKGNK